VGKKYLPVILVVLGLGTVAMDVRAQDPSDISPDTIGPYSVTSSIEVGVRGVKVEGDIDKYRSDLNYQPGFQFMDSSFLLEAGKDGGPLFDSLLVKVTGWDSDPNGYLRVSMDKLDVYRFDTTVRRFNYYNSLNTIALGQHVDETVNTIGDVNLVLMPQNPKFKINLDYAFNRKDGPTLSTYDFSRDEFPVFAPSRSRSDTFSAGFDAKLGWLDLSFLQGYRTFKDDAEFFITQPQAGNSGPIVLSFLNTFNRDAPQRGHVNFSRVNAHAFLNNMVDITGRVIYSNAKSESTLFESLSGGDFTGALIGLNQIAAFSESERPTWFADLGISVLATESLTISNTFRYNRFEINGTNDEVIQTIKTAPAASFTELEEFFSRMTRYRQFSNTLELDYMFHPRVSAHVGYRYTDRSNDLESLEFDPADPGEIEPEIETFDNRTNTFIFGLRAKPIKNFWTVYFDFERGEADNVFTRAANYDYTNARIRNIIYATDELTFNLSATFRNNDNPTRTDDVPSVDFGTSTESRMFSASADWVPNSKVALSTGYTYSRITSDSVVVFFFNFQKKQGVSEFYSRDQFAYINVNAQVHDRVGLFGSMRFHNDSGAGDRVPPGPETLIAGYPYRYVTPEVRLSIRLHDRIDFIAGYQYYDFEERFKNLGVVESARVQDYNAHLPYASLRFYFGRRE
jgi:hypothetical protein